MAKSKYSINDLLSRNNCAIILLAILCLFSHSAFANNQHSEQLAESIQQAEKLIAEGKELVRSGGDTELASNYFQTAKSIAQKIKHSRLLYESYLGEALLGYYNAQYESSFKLLDSILTLIPEKEIDLIASGNKLIGNDLVYMGKYAEAYEHQLKALEYYKSISDQKNLALLYFSIGNNFFYQNQYELAIKEFNQALEIWEARQDKKGIFWAVGAIGSVHEHLQNIDQAILFSERALAMAYKLDSPADVAWTLYNIGSIATTAGDLKKGLKKLKEAQHLALELNDKPLLGYTLESITAVHLHLKEYQQALEVLDQSYLIARGNKDLANIPGLYKLYSEIYFAKNDFKSYKNYIDKYIGLKDSLKNEELAASMGNLKQDFEVREFQKTKEIALLKKDASINNFKKLIWIGSVSFAAIIFLLLFVFVKINNRNEKTKNQLLVTANNKIITQNEQLKASNKDLKQYAYIISHDLKEPLRNIGSFTNLLQRSLGNNINSNAKEYMNYITSGVSQMHTLLTDLKDYAKIKSKSGLGSKINCHEILNTVIGDLAPTIQERNVKFTIEILPEIHMDADHFQQIIFNFLTNAIKFNESPKPHINISSEQKEDFYHFSIKDNGIGIESAFLEKIFVVFQRLNNRKDYLGSGIGLSSCKKIINDYGGEVWVDSAPQKGSTFHFSIPISKMKSAVNTKPQEVFEAVV